MSNNTFKEIPVSSLRIDSPFKDILPFDDRAVTAIADSMRESGYDTAFPIVVWKDREGLIVDGHLRFAAAQKAGLKSVFIFEKEFSDEEQALDYSLHHNLYRKSCTDDEAIEIYEKGIMGVLCGARGKLLKNARKACEVK